MRKKLVGTVLAALIGVIIFSGCDGTNRADPTVDDVVNHFSSMARYEVANDGSKTAISAEKSGTLFVLATRQNLKKVNAKRCRVNGKAMHGSSSDLNYPAGNGQNYFPFARIHIDRSGDYELTCSQPDNVSLIALLDPTG
ncbi:hypothetical protein [Bifidobacterium bombi]|uniref:Lipoprotein n=1 Tax=Bifidobacterium bombi DSM 19703 TaxID=1341695 RepID=A0A080N1X3_9BIFI|nr:hypothetical protein [Bifidobacterium bombi]KFF30868.1 hypothetical protein BBOMB_0185 [Bifidobacterium bombi DSM 19703]